MAHLRAVFRGALIVIPGILTLIEGTDDKGAVRGVIEFGNWLRHTGRLVLPGTQNEVVKELYLHAKGGTYDTEEFHHVMHDNPDR
jgi:hypothetical protein